MAARLDLAIAVVDALAMLIQKCSDLGFRYARCGSTFANKSDLCAAESQPFSPWQFAPELLRCETKPSLLPAWLGKPQVDYVRITKHLQWSRSSGAIAALTLIGDSITSYIVKSSAWRSSFERIRLLVKIGSRPRPRLQQISTWLDRSCLVLPIPWKVLPLDASAPPPVVIGATGGSGTRVMARVLRKAGWFLGNRVDPLNEDSLPVAWFLTKWLKKLKDFPNVDSRTLARARRDFERMIHLHRRGISLPNARWGWKNPRSLWLIPFLVERFPKLKFIHMIRDARDMMLSGNLYFLRQNGHWLLGPDWWRDPEVAQLELWRASNKRALECAKHYLNDRYYMVRYEDLCRKPAETVSAVMTFLETPEINVEPLIEGIRDRGNIGRWRRADTRKVIELGQAAQADLARFGYDV